MSRYPSKKLVKQFIPFRYRWYLRRNGFGKALKLLYSLPEVNLFDLVVHLPRFCITVKAANGKKITIKRDERKEDND